MIAFLAERAVSFALRERAEVVACAALPIVSGTFLPEQFPLLLFVVLCFGVHVEFIHGYFELYFVLGLGSRSVVVSGSRIWGRCLRQRPLVELLSPVGLGT